MANTLRGLLDRVDEELAHSLRACWQVAQEQWIPCLKVESESHAGIPHLISVERWVDKVCDECDSQWTQRGLQGPFSLNPLEIYVLLAGVLFHDIGRAKQGASKKHGAESRNVVQRHWAQLGIKSERIATIIGDVIAFHTAADVWTGPAVVYIHPYGAVHVQAIASLLALADELDTAYDRAMPDYLLERAGLLEEENGRVPVELLCDMATKGLMRGYIIGLDLVPESKLIQTVIHGSRLPDAAEKLDKGTRSWQENVWNTNLTRNFDTEDYYFAVLSRLTSEIPSAAIGALAQLHQMACNTEMHNAVSRLTPPPDFEGSERLHRLLQLGRRELSAYPSRRSVKLTRAVDDLAATVDLVKETVGWVCRHTGKKEETVPGALMAGKIECADCVAAGVRYEKPSEDAEPHAALIYSLRCGLHNATEKGTGCLARDPEDYHRNLLEAFESYLKHVPSYCLDEGYAGYWHDVLAAEPPRPKLGRVESEEVQAPVCTSATVVPDSNGRGPESADSGLSAGSEQRMVSAPQGEANEGGVASESGSGGAPTQPATQTYPAENKTEPRTSEGRTALDGSQGTVAEQRDALAMQLQVAVDYYRRSVARAGRAGATLSIRDARFVLSLVFMDWVARDLTRKQETLDRIAPGLRMFDIPFSRWYLGYGRHLFDDRWRVMLEPNLMPVDVEEAAEAVFELDRDLMRDKDDAIPWSSIATRMRDARMPRVKTCVFRASAMLDLLHGITADSTPDFGYLLRCASNRRTAPTITTSQSGCQVLPTVGHETTEKRTARCQELDKLVKSLETLAGPGVRDKGTGGGG
jgi:hypothetical protein